MDLLNAALPGIIILAAIALVYAGLLSMKINRQKAGNAKMKEIASAIKE